MVLRPPGQWYGMVVIAVIGNFTSRLKLKYEWHRQSWTCTCHIRSSNFNMNISGPCNSCLIVCDVGWLTSKYYFLPDDNRLWRVKESKYGKHLIFQVIVFINQRNFIVLVLMCVQIKCQSVGYSGIMSPDPVWIWYRIRHLPKSRLFRIVKNPTNPDVAG